MNRLRLNPRNPKERLVVTEDFDWREIKRHRGLGEVFDEYKLVKLGDSFLRYPRHRDMLVPFRVRNVGVILDLGYESLKRSQIHYNLERDAESQYGYVTVAANMGAAVLERHVDIAGSIGQSPGIVVKLGRRHHREGPDDEVENILEAQTSLAERGRKLSGIILDSDQLDRLDGLSGIPVIASAIRLPGDSIGEHDAVMTPAEALRRGAHYFAVGEPIARAEDPLAAAHAYTDSLR